MKAAASLSLIALLATSAIAADMQASNAPVGVSPAHMRLAIARSKARREASGKQYKRCKAHNKSGGGEPAPSASSPPYVAPSPAPKPADPPAPAPPTGGGGGGTITVGGACGDNGAIAKTTKTAGPNGSETFLNCGIEGAGWNPPNLQLHDIKYKNLDEEFANPNSIFKACKQFASNIYDSAGKYDIPPIMVASIMMQESSCNPETVGGGGEQGLMQITKDKCGGAPGGNCKDPAFNIDKGVSYLAGQIKACNGNVLEAVGTYNGWYKGLTYGGATAAKNSACCRCQNNLDYPHQFFNAWLQGIDAYSTDVGTYKNLNSCN